MVIDLYLSRIETAKKHIWLFEIKVHRQYHWIPLSVNRARDYFDKVYAQHFCFVCFYHIIITQQVNVRQMHCFKDGFNIYFDPLIIIIFGAWCFLGPLLRILININLSMDKQLHPLQSVAWNCISSPKLQRCSRSRLGWISNFITNFTGHVISYPYWGSS